MLLCYLPKAAQQAGESLGKLRTFWLWIWVLTMGGIEFLKKSNRLESYDRCIFYMQVMLQLNKQKGAGITGCFLASKASVKLSLAHHTSVQNPLSTTVFPSLLALAIHPAENRAAQKCLHSLIAPH